MLNSIRKFFAPPVFEDEDKTRIARYFNAIALTTSFVLVIVLALRFSSGSLISGTVNIILMVLIGIMLVTRYLVTKGFVKPASHTLVLLSWVGLAYLAWDADGIRDSTFYALVVVILMASLLLGTRAMFVYAAASFLLGFWLSSLELSGEIQTTIDLPTNFARDLAFVFALISIFIYLITNSLNSALANARRSARDFQVSNEELRALQDELEARVMERTTELETAHQQVERRAEQFEAIAQVSRIISSIQEQEELLPRITHMISRHFGFYHVGVFLLDENNQYAILRAANSEGGRRMLERKHRLEVGQTGIVGHVTSTGSPRIALDTGADAVYFDNLDLPDTRSEMALPLMTGSQVIGALDVQSTESNAFTQEDIAILTVLADQVSTAIQNARLYEESREALAQAEAASRQLTGEAWKNVRRFTPLVGYHFDGTKPEPLTHPANGKQANKQKDAYSVPVKLRNETIGILRIKSPKEGYQWTEDEIAIIHATAERVALAAENARLILESQKNAAKEQVISEVSSKIGAAINLDNILQTTLREMGRILPGAEISIQVENE